ncbi:MAG: ATP-binding protein [Methanomassiliicoccaceae archaeon]|nr:ATP-binding protein [Methanomassiliicoccaceae archaeon]
MAKDTIIREDYVEKLMRYKDQTDLVKVITGMRRSGKSTLLQQFMDRLIENGVKEERITYLNFDSKKNKHLLGEDLLYDHLISKVSEKGSYIFLDEIQNVPGWERVIDSLMIDTDADIYVTGSNAYMLSTDLSTYLTGRSIPIHVLPLSFKEFKELNSLEDNEKAFGDYISTGSMPKLRADMSKDDAFEIVNAIRLDIMFKDIAYRKKLTDVRTLERVIDYLFSEMGNPISGSSVSRELKIDDKTAESYLQTICESLMFYQAKRFDLKGKTVLTTPSIYYCTDLGMRNAAIGEYSRDIGRSIENVVYLELLRRGYSVHTGKIGNREIDFVAAKSGKKEYYQVSMTILDENTREREIRPFRELNSPGKRTILTMDRLGLGSEDNVDIINVIDWLVGTA